MSTRLCAGKSRARKRFCNSLLRIRKFLCAIKVSCVDNPNTQLGIASRAFSKIILNCEEDMLYLIEIVCDAAKARCQIECAGITRTLMSLSFQVV